MTVKKHSMRLFKKLHFRKNNNYFLPVSVLVLFLVLTTVVWQKQINFQKELLVKHTEDVCVQTSKRLHLLVDSQIKLADVFTKHLSTYDKIDLIKHDFDEFALSLISKVPGYNIIRFKSSLNKLDWTVPSNVEPHEIIYSDLIDKLIKEAELKNSILLSEPVKSGNGNANVYAVFPLYQKNKQLGSVIVEYDLEDMINSGFNDNIRSEFNFKFEDSGLALYSHIDRSKNPFDKPVFYSKKTVRVLNREWNVFMVPQKSLGVYANWRVNLLIPVFGILLSMVLSSLVYLLLKRIEMYKMARDKAIIENEDRESAQKALKSSEIRYRSVFDSTTNGLIILDSELKILNANKAALSMHVYEKDELVGKSLSVLISPESLDVVEKLKQHLKQFGTVQLDSINRSSGNKDLDITIKGTTFMFDGKQRVLLILTDISEMRKAMQRHATLSRRILVAQEAERTRVSRDLHDELGQILTALHIELSVLKKKCESKDDVLPSFGNAVDMVEKAAEELRNICRGLRPQVLDDLGLEPAIKHLVEEFEERTKIKTEYDIKMNDMELRIPSEIALCTYRILQESLNNIIRHAIATEVNIFVAEDGNQMMLSVFDNGQGFNADDASANSGSGIEGMRERAFLVNGTVDIRSEINHGTRIIFRVNWGNKNKEKIYEQNTRS